ncbi:hypothetical protein HHK36_015925 [Tetracentron sinense]|uniref:Uncharacterized protein n=1 Tax=Tetracentron sinense TaxID=13715 RepID=A0A834Z650_TETSI|nr:hypothetical protein HHK36_015925 [Tetracentron sinense]
MEKIEKQPLKMETLNMYYTNLTKLALEIERVTQILCKRRKNNPCLVGEPGVGKTVIAEGLAQGITNAKVPLKLQGKKVISMDMGRLIAGASNRGEFEERLMKVMDEVTENDGKIILFIGAMHTLIGAGAGGQALDAANILKPALARGELKCIGATTLDEYRKHIKKDPALERRFQLVNVPEPSVEGAIQILKGLQKQYEIHHNVRYADKAFVAAAHLSNRYISDPFLPDKAIDVIDEAGIPVEKVSGEESEQLLNMEKTLHERIIGQDKAVEAIGRAICRARVGLRDPCRPIASFLFTGPTGVGKTELANALAAQYFGSKEAIIRLDMSEFMERHTVSKMIGSPPGYLGYGEGSHLTEAVRHRPHSIILVDDIEKAHPDVLNIMLQILDDGRLTDSNGRIVDFKSTLIIMTSNIGSNVIGKGNYLPGFNKEEKVAEELKKCFRPEFLSRLDEVIAFGQLTLAQVKKIVNLMLKEVYERLMGKNIKLQVTQRFKDRVTEDGYNPSYGARSLRRTIVRLLEDSFAKKMLNREINEGDSVTMDVDSEGVAQTTIFAIHE